MPLIRLIALLLIDAVSQYAVAADDPAAPIRFSQRERTSIFAHSPLGLPPPDPTNRVADDPPAAHMGQYLFFDKRFSDNGQISCSHCHTPKRGFADAKPLSEGIKVGRRNTPTIWNVAYNRWFNWDGRFDSLWSQALGPIENEAEFAGSRLQLAHLVVSDAKLRVAYGRVFEPLPDLSDTSRFPLRARPVPSNPNHPHHAAWNSMTESDQHKINTIFVNVAKAIAAYQRRVTSRASAFDTFVEGLKTADVGKLQALSPSAQRGLKLFIGSGKCELCHVGPNFTDGEFHNILVPPLDGGQPRDPGRYGAIRQLRDNGFNAAGGFSDDRKASIAEMVGFLADSPEAWGRFKTPTLRNVARTAPYMHQGQFATLHDVVHYYSTLEGAVRGGHHQEQVLVPLNLSRRQIDDLVAFLESLTDDSLDPALLRQPASPIWSQE